MNFFPIFQRTDEWYRGISWDATQKQHRDDKIGAQIQFREEEIEKLMKENPNKEMVPILLGHFRAEREAEKQRMEIIRKSMVANMTMIMEAFRISNNDTCNSSKKNHITHVRSRVRTVPLTLK